jgi:pimeloyl-ACP methyl ester carboxylesterase
MKFVDASGVRIAYERAGTGPLLVLLHGAASDHRLWRPQVDRLAGDFTVVAWDEPGAGASGEVPDGFRLEDYAACAGTLIEDLGLGPAHVAGLSWGGTIALELYRGSPGLVKTLILADSYAGWKGSLPPAEVESRVALAREMVSAPPGKFNPELPGLFAGDPPIEFVPLLEEMAADVRPRSLGVQMSVMADADLRDLLPLVDVPTLLIWGESDARAPLTIAHQLDDAIPDTRLIVLPDCGHVSNLEQPDLFDQAVREFAAEA